MDLSETIKARSDQLNADDLMGGPITVQVLGVDLITGDQPVAVRITGGHQPWKPCKTMRRLLVAAWGSDGAAWKGRWLTLYRDPAVKFGSDQVGGIRVSAVSHIAKPLVVSLTATKGKKTGHKVEVLTPPSADMPFPEFRQRLGDALKRGWLKEEIDALLGGPASDVPAGDRAALVAKLGQPPIRTRDDAFDPDEAEDSGFNPSAASSSDDSQE